MGKRLSEAEKNIAFAMRAKGSTFKEVSNCLGKPFQTVYYLLNEQQRLKRNKITKRWVRENPDRVKAYMRDYRRLHSVTTGERHVFGLNKRARPEACELCRKNSRLLHYHHWDDSNLDIGLWLCVSCHRFAEAVEAGMPKYASKYQELKQEAIREVACRNAVRLRNRALQLKSRLNGNHNEQQI